MYVCVCVRQDDDVGGVCMYVHVCVCACVCVVCACVRTYVTVCVVDVKC